jgi:hypothetical protein
VKTINNQTQILAIGGTYDLVSQIKSLNGAVSLAQELERERHAVLFGYVTEFVENSHGLVNYFNSCRTTIGDASGYNDYAWTTNLSCNVTQFQTLLLD